MKAVGHLYAFEKEEDVRKNRNLPEDCMKETKGPLKRSSHCTLPTYTQ